jgi:TolB protein
MLFGYSKYGRIRKMKWFKTISLFVFVSLLVALPMGSTAPGKVYIDINAPGFNKFPLAIPDFTRLGGTVSSDIESEARNTLLNDLHMAGMFKVIDPSLYTPNPESDKSISRTNYDIWRRVGAEAVIKGGYNISGSALTVEIYLFDTVNKRRIWGRRYRGSTAHLSRMIHKFTDDLMMELTGEKGIFQSRITYVTALHGKKEIYYMDVDGKNLFRLTRNRVIDLSPSWSPNGKRIVYCSFKQRSPKIFSVDVFSFSERMIAGFEGINISPSYSPGGGRIAFTSSKERNYYPNIYTVSESGGGLKRLTRGNSIDVSPTFSPDGRRIAFTSNRGGSPQIYIMGANGGAIKRITYSGGYNTSPEWSPKGDKIVYVGSYRGRFEVYVINVDGTGNMRLTGGRGDNEDPSWSPDGRLITFSSTRNGRGEIFWMRADGTDQTKIIGPVGNCSSPAWSPRVNFK